MLVSFVLRVDRDRLAAGALAGEIEHVESGMTQPLRSTEELVSCCQRLDLPPLQPEGSTGND